MNCPECALGMSVVKTMVLGSTTQRLRECECGIRCVTVETVTKVMQPGGSNLIQLPVTRATAGQPPGNGQATTPQPLGGFGGPLPSGSDLPLLSDPDPNPNVAVNPKRARARRAEVPAAFASFWALYPRHVAKAAALKAWIKIDPTSELIQSIMAAITWQRVDFLRREPDKVPHAATWLNQSRWEDERPARGSAPTRGQQTVDNLAAWLSKESA